MNNGEVRRPVAPTSAPAREDEEMVKVAIAGLIGAFLVFYIMSSPDQAAGMVKGIGHVATNVAHGVGNFLDKLAS
jgi:hypothetical protein